MSDSDDIRAAGRSGGFFPFEALAPVSTPELRSGYKIALSMHHGDTGERFVDIWRAGEDVADACLWSTSTGKISNYRIGDRVLGFIRLDRDQYLLVTACEITSVPPAPGPCGRADLPEWKWAVGGLVIRTHKGNTRSRWIFGLENYMAKHAVSVEGLRGRPRGPEFRGYDDVLLTFPELLRVSDDAFSPDYRNALASVDGVYLLRDRLTGRMYVGSAYGADGMAQRWRCYLDTATGGNKSLVELYRREGRAYFEKNFSFKLLEWFPKSRHYPPDRVIARENHWKEALGTREFGYNEN